MKKSIVVATSSMSIIILFSIYSSVVSQGVSTGSFLRLIIPFLILLGIIKGNRLAWQWGRLLTILAFVGILISTIMIFIKGGSYSQANPFLFVGVPSLLIFISFGTYSAKEHFRLICPNCVKAKIKPDDFLFNNAKCKKCNHVW